jgi:hypothetical protein
VRQHRLLGIGRTPLTADGARGHGAFNVRCHFGPEQQLSCALKALLYTQVACVNFGQHFGAHCCPYEDPFSFEDHAIDERQFICEVPEILRLFETTLTRFWPAVLNVSLDSVEVLVFSCSFSKQVYLLVAHWQVVNYAVNLSVEVFRGVTRLWRD